MLEIIGEGFALFFTFSLGGRGDGERKRISVRVKVKG